MARMSIDDSVTRDARVAVLAKLCGWNRYEALGHLLDVWAACYDRVTPYLSEMIVDASACFDGFAKHMVTAELACFTDDGFVRISGVEARIGYLSDKAKAGRKGGIKSGESRRNMLQAESKQTSSKHEAPANPIPIVPDPVPDPVPASVPDPDPPRVTQKKNAPAEPSPSGYRESVDLFFLRFEAAYQAKPSWGQKQGSQLKRLLGSHSAAEVQRRIAILFDSPPNWLTPPFDFGTLVQHFDKLVVASVPRGASSGRIEPSRPGDYPEGELAL